MRGPASRRPSFGLGPWDDKDFEPPVARNPVVVLIACSVTISPVVELAQAVADPLDDLLSRDFRPT
jgi:hypothetical protein